MSESGGQPTRRLPAGPHGLPPELVERNQRERLIAAMAESCAERGYAASSVADVAKRAGVSTASFYRQFADKRECMLASFEELFERLLTALEGACEGESEPAAKARAGAALAAGLLAGDRPTARLLSVEILAVGPDGVSAQQAAIERMAALLRGPGVERGAEDSGAKGADHPDAEPAAGPDAAWACVAAMVSLIARRVADGTSPDPAELEVIAKLL